MKPVGYPMYARDHSSTIAPDVVHPINATTVAVTGPYSGRASLNRAYAANPESSTAISRSGAEPVQNVSSGATR